jgi:hypothetical protein
LLISSIIELFQLETNIFVLEYPLTPILASFVNGKFGSPEILIQASLATARS